jgi:hypothetical protein
MSIEFLLLCFACLVLGLALEVVAFWMYSEPHSLVYCGSAIGLCTVLSSVAIYWYICYTKVIDYDRACQLIGLSAVFGTIMFAIVDRGNMAISFVGTQLITLSLSWLGGPNATIIALGVAFYSMIGMLIGLSFKALTLIPL